MTRIALRWTSLRREKKSTTQTDVERISGKRDEKVQDEPETRCNGGYLTENKKCRNMNSFKLALKKKSRLMETISYIKGQCNNLNGRTEDFIYY